METTLKFQMRRTDGQSSAEGRQLSVRVNITRQYTVSWVVRNNPTARASLFDFAASLRVREGKPLTAAAAVIELAADPCKKTAEALT